MYVGVHNIQEHKEQDNSFGTKYIHNVTVPDTEEVCPNKNSNTGV